MIYAHFGPAFFTWHRWFNAFLENEIQAILKDMGREDYYKFRLPYWDWRREIQRSYGLPSEQLFTFDRFGETRNISNRPIVFGELADGWNAICMNTRDEICDPNIITGFFQRCPFTRDPNLCRSINPDWPTMQDVNDLMEYNDYSVPPYNVSALDSFRGHADFIQITDIDQCREDIYCICLPGGPLCEVEQTNDIQMLTTGVHAKVYNTLN